MQNPSLSALVYILSRASLSIEDRALIQGELHLPENTIDHVFWCCVKSQKQNVLLNFHSSNENPHPSTWSHFTNLKKCLRRRVEKSLLEKQYQIIWRDHSQWCHATTQKLLKNNPSWQIQLTFSWPYWWWHWFDVTQYCSCRVMHVLNKRKHNFVLG